ncbi:UDP-N-acetylmuramyl tripeptide synthase [[Synechococcus] sp. NIES-970]|uniref:Mur ligase family protein n=1 Tax=Picosynechococcus sp. NKBG15041c TaxID=1407650 RepID=UPI00041A5E66|nr:Mur ligase family protein [Picosynechococcus sp. NKBG15041c]BAW96255.1 UDP-N-acetylmuramyl tripeptide synthase [[Synechococcus] sp. NIES-970]
MAIFDGLRLAIACSLGKTITGVVRGLKLSAGSVLPGAIARRIFPDILPDLFKQARKGVILVAGTNGKTTTSLLIKAILTAQGYKLAHNASGANLINGLTTALLEHANLFGQLDIDYGILEVDENIIPILLKNCAPTHILALNLFRDQLDRYGEVDTISLRWQEAIAPLPPETTIIVNGDDPTLNYLGQNLSQTVKYFGLNEPELYLEAIPHAVDSIYCPRCGAPLNYQGVYLSHLGDYHCDSCGFKKNALDINSQDWGQILIGVYNKYNTLAAALLAETLGIHRDVIDEQIQSFKAAFGRAEELTIQGKHVRILLSKNPVGMNETIRAVTDLQGQGKTSTVLVVLNDRTPDGTDVSWIWDVDLEKLTQAPGKIIISGDRTHDMALRLRYCEGNAELIVEPDLTKALDQAIALSPEDQTLHILPTYSAMLEVRQMLTGRKIL